MRFLSHPKMHKKAQYVDGKLIDEKGQFVDDKPKLKPPPPPPIVVKEVVVKRKNISISLKTWELWKEIKGTKKWDTILNEAIVLFNKVKDLEDIITKIALQRPTIIQGANYVPNNFENSTRIPNAKRTVTPPSRKKKLPFLEEIKDLVEQLEKEERDIRSILTPLEEINQEDIQHSEEELIKRMEANKKLPHVWRNK